MRLRTPRRGFTLVEMLFVVLIILILMSLLLVAVQSAMRSSRRAACQKNLSEVGRSLRQFLNQFDGRSPGTMADVGGSQATDFSGNPPYTPTGGLWTLPDGRPTTPTNTGTQVGMQGWDGYMGFVLNQYQDEVRRMWSCTETATPYIGNMDALGRQIPIPRFRSVNYTRNFTGLPLGTTVITSIQNPGRCVIAYDAGIGLAGEGGIVSEVTDNCTDFDDGGYPSRLTYQKWGYLWYNKGGGKYLEGPHQRAHLMLRADGSVDTLKEPSTPLSPALDGDIVTDPTDASQATRTFTRFPKVSLF